MLEKKIIYKLNNYIYDKYHFSILYIYMYFYLFNLFNIIYAII